MNRRQKIIVSVTGIFIVLLVLIGLTYAYFLTRITGNGNPTSISVTTANLELVYGDGTTAILTSSNPLMPSSTPIGTKDFTVTNNGDDSEYVVVFEDVTVKYAADTVIDGQAVAKDTPTTFESNDFVYTLTCTVKDKSGNTLSDKSCDGVENETFPMDGGIVLGNSIDKDDVHSYVLTLYYLDNGLDQSADMNKTLNGKVNIKDIKSINPYSENTSSLAYNIINNSMLNKNGTELVSVPDTKVAEEVSWTKGTGRYETKRYYYTSWEEGGYEWDGLTYGATQDLADDIDGGVPSSIEEGTDPVQACESVKGQYISDIYYCYYDGCDSIGKVVDCEEDGTPVLDENYYDQKEEIMLKEKVLSTTSDNYGTSYYFRGDVEDNYVTFSNKCWRIVRIQGDGSIKLTLESQSLCSESMTSDFSIGITNWGYKIENSKYIGDYKNSTNGMKNKLTTWLNATDDNGVRENITSNAEKLLKTEEWCLGNSRNIYDYSSPYGLLGTTASENYALGTKFYYETGRNLYGKGITPNATLKCNGETDISKIGVLTADEIVFAGGKMDEENDNYYLKKGSWLTISRSLFDGNHDLVLVNVRGYLDYNDVDILLYGVRPAVSLNANVEITSGEGTLKKPYIIAE